MLLLADPPISKQDGAWSEEEKAKTFATHLSKIFKPNPREITLEEENDLFSDDIISVILDTPIRIFNIKKVRAEIRNLNLEKVEYNLISNQILQKLPEMGKKYITQLCNAVLRRRFFPS